MITLNIDRTDFYKELTSERFIMRLEDEDYEDKNLYSSQVKLVSPFNYMNLCFDCDGSKYSAQADFQMISGFNVNYLKGLGSRLSKNFLKNFIQLNDFGDGYVRYESNDFPLISVQVDSGISTVSLGAYGAERRSLENIHLYNVEMNFFEKVLNVFLRESINLSSLSMEKVEIPKVNLCLQHV